MASQSWLSPRCAVCGSNIEGGLLYMCPACNTPHHAECWDYSKGCSTYGCVEAGSMRPAQSLPALTPGPKFSPAQRVVLSALCLPAGLGIVLALIMTFTHPLAAMALLFGSYLGFLLGWRSALRPLAIEAKVVGTLSCLLLGATSTGLMVMGLLLFWLGISNTLLPSVLILLGFGMGSESFLLFRSLEEPPRIPPPGERPALTEADRVRLEKERARASGGTDDGVTG